jgi:hypothetical protein
MLEFLIQTNDGLGDIITYRDNYNKLTAKIRIADLVVTAI